MLVVSFLIVSAVIVAGIFIRTLIKEYNKNVLVLSLVITMLINMFAIHKVNILGFILMIVMPVSVVYVIGIELVRAKEFEDENIN
ncbi:MAG: hypothetical protein SPI74_01195 [Eubacterium sp.]|nr:hypothetical protein [Eubacterium sp.]